MSCVSVKPVFRLLDQYVGWDEKDTKGLSGINGDALRLALLDPGSVDPNALWPLISPAWLSPGCNRCQWYLVCEDKLLRRDDCGSGFRVVCSGFISAKGVAVRRHRVAVSDQSADQIILFSGDGAYYSLAFQVNDPGALTLMPSGEVAVATHAGKRISRFNMSGDLLSEIEVQPDHTVIALASSNSCDLWVVTATQSGALYLWRSTPEGDGLRVGDLDELKKEKSLVYPLESVEFKTASVNSATKSCCADTNSSLVQGVPSVENTSASSLLDRVAENGFCLKESNRDGEPLIRCFDRCGSPVEVSELSLDEGPRYWTQGQLLTNPIDSGIPRCRWHRLRIRAEVPFGCELQIAVATSETNRPNYLGSKKSDEKWQSFEPGPPHEGDWQIAPQASKDFLVDQPAGRYLFVRVRFTGNGRTTPVLRQVRLDFPRITSLDKLPSVYREDPVAADFQERFLSLFDASLDEVDCAIERYATLLDPSRAPNDVLPWIGAFLDITFDMSWSTEQRRSLLLEAPTLYRMRGTPVGLSKIIELIYGVEPIIEELSLNRSFAALSKNSYLRATRLFSRAKSRFRLGSSPLGGPKLRSHGDPEQDPLNAHAFRFRVSTPPLSGQSTLLADRLVRLINNLKPAHTIAQIRTGGETGFAVGRESIVGVDTLFKSLRAPVLGRAGNIKLGRTSVLWPARHGKGPGFAVGKAAAVGINTLME